jgi:proline iminopeptidase
MIEGGLLEVGDGNRVAWEVLGNPEGKPAVIVHGGPGAGRPSGTAKAFDPERYRIVLFDQRGCGLSTPHAGIPSTDLTVNTTAHLIGDMELLREHLGIEKWLVFGGSWGSTLSIAYAERHPERVSELVLVAFWLMRRREVDWLYRGGVARIFPGEWERFASGVPDPVALYRARLDHPDADVRAKAAVEWARWEDTVLSLEPNGIPGVILHGKHDLSCPLDGAWEFAERWPEGELMVFDDAGHKGSPAMNDQLRAVLRRLGT